MAQAQVTFGFESSRYSFVESDDTLLKGRLSCDCVRSELIRQHCDVSFPAMSCGTRISVVSYSTESDEISLLQDTTFLERVAVHH